MEDTRLPSVAGLGQLELRDFTGRLPCRLNLEVFVDQDSASATELGTLHYTVQSINDTYLDRLKSLEMTRLKSANTSFN